MRYGRPRARRRVSSLRRSPVRRPVRSNPRAPRKKTKLGTWKKRKATARKYGTKAGPRPTGVRRQRSAAKKAVASKPKKRKTAKRKPAATKKRTYKKRATAKRKPATKKRRSYKKKSTAAKRKPRKKTARKTTRRPVSKKRRSYKKKSTARKPTKKSRSAAARKAARTRAANKKKRSDAARKAARTRKRRSKMARPVSRKRRSYRKRSKSRRKFKTRARKPLGRHRGKRRYVISGRKRGRKWARHPKRTYAPVRRHKRRTRRARAHVQKYYVRKNPLNALKAMVKDGVMTFAGILGIRAISKVLQDNVFNSATFQTGAMASVAPLLAPGVAMVLAALAPKVMSSQPKLVAGLQAGATLVFFDSALKVILQNVDPQNKFSGYLLPAAPQTVVTPTTTSGWGGYREYVGSPLGLEVESAMALDEYVSSPQLGMGGDFDVEEALAGNETNAFESGYAGGSLAKTVFSNY